MTAMQGSALEDDGATMKRAREDDCSMGFDTDKRPRLHQDEAMVEPSCPNRDDDTMMQDAPGPHAAAVTVTSAGRHNDDMTVFVKGLKSSVTHEELMMLFSQCSGLKAVRVVHNHHGRIKGCAYVEFDSREGLFRALSLDGSIFQGKQLVVARSQPPPPCPKADRQQAACSGPANLQRCDKRPPPEFLPVYGGHHRHHLQLTSAGTATLPAQAAYPTDLTNQDFRQLLLLRRLNQSST